MGTKSLRLKLVIDRNFDKRCEIYQPGLKSPNFTREIGLNLNVKRFTPQSLL